MVIVALIRVQLGILVIRGPLLLKMYCKSGTTEQSYAHWLVSGIKAQ